jgi:cytochrome bd-type quinol oxidase subunit 2
MDQTAFYGVVSGINFTLLGLWWVAVKDRLDLASGTASFRRMAYFVSLQFVVPATIALFAQVAPDVADVWRSAFALAGLVGIAGTLMLAYEMSVQTDAKILPALFAVVGAPLYLLVVVVALWPGVVGDLELELTPIEVEGFLLTIVVFLGVQAAWFVHMTPTKTEQS